MRARTVRASDFHRRPWYVRGLNRLLAVGPERSLNKDSLLRSARQRTGLRDFGEGPWDEALRRLLRSIETEAHLHPLGRIMLREQILGRLEQRLWAEYWFQKHPEILEQDLHPVWLITGLQRTGTTRLQRLLAADPNTRSLLSWEAMFPAPMSADWPKRDRRLAKTRRAARALGWLAPKFQAIHPIVPELPEEDVLLLDLSFMSTSWEAMLHVPSFAAWLEGADQAPPYRYELKLLKLLQWQDQRRARSGGAGAGQRRWILKSPHHLEWLDVVDRVFPTVHYIWTHRDPRECIPSWLSMLAHGRAIFSEEVDLEAIKAHWLRKDRRMVSRGKAFRQAGPSGLFWDLLYDDFLNHPDGTLESLYSKMGLYLPEELRVRVLNAVSKDRNPPYGRHTYHLADFGLEEKDLPMGDGFRSL